MANWGKFSVMRPKILGNFMALIETNIWQSVRNITVMFRTAAKEGIIIRKGDARERRTSDSTDFGTTPIFLSKNKMPASFPGEERLLSPSDKKRQVNLVPRVLSLTRESSREDAGNEVGVTSTCCHRHRSSY